MALILRPCQAESDYFRVRNFLRAVFLLNNRLEDSWHVARLDYWRWHFIATCQSTPPFEQVTVAWETEQGELAAVLHPIGGGEIRTHIHPRFRSPGLEAEIYTYAVEHFSEKTEHGAYLIAPVLADDRLRQDTLARLGFSKQPGWNHHYWRDLDAPLPEVPTPAGYLIRSMGAESEHPSRSWCSWRAFHAGEPDSSYDGDYTWYKNVQSAPLYRRDLDVVAAAPGGEIAAFCTIYYDDYTRSAVTVLVGVAAEHWRRGLGKAVLIEGLRRLQRLGCTRVFATANEEPADALYRSVMTNMRVTDTWVYESAQPAQLADHPLSSQAVPARVFPVLTTPRLVLREFTLADVPAVFEIFRRPDVNEFVETEIMKDIQDAEVRVKSRMGLFRDQMGLRWAVALRTDPERLIGSCGYFSVRRGTATVEIGYDLHPDFWGQGMMTEALRTVIAYSFGAQALMPVHRIEALVLPENRASLRVLEKLGFEPEGLRREFGFWKGRYCDVFLYALLNPSK